ncbi:MAG: tRNA lysidine(34) synthetase TilS, partial [Desulfurivibrionaceae bacterium]
MTITHPLEEHTLRQIRELGVPTAGGLLLAGVSGGADSVALLHLLAAVAGELKFGLCAVYVD